MNAQAIYKLRQKLLTARLDSLLVTKRANVAYLSEFTGEAQLLITQRKKILIVDFRFQEQAQREVKTIVLWPRQSFQPLNESIAQLAKKLKIKRLGFEANSLSYGSYARLNKQLGLAQLLPVYDLIEPLRAIKTIREIQYLRTAAQMAVKTFMRAQQLIRPGKKERSIAAELEYFMCAQGAESPAFDIIVASGIRSALPHAPHSSKIIRKNEAVLVDLGCRILGYNSDLTRMLFLGKIKDKLKRAYQVVLSAQQQAIKAVRPGQEIGRIDQIARQYITQAGLGAFFGHALGHGIGREVHEYPAVTPRSRALLKPGMVLTIEPGVYLPGVGGARVEDMVLVTRHGCEILTRSR
ncbi:MAG: aminopeptidase P family protein [Candidatus Omnitrophica bacterium]|nr:aminopeptidase P family protein [Candidatus Omnitrophota bacterium]